MSDKKKNTKKKADTASKKSTDKSAANNEFAFESAHMLGKNMSFAASEAYKTLRTNLMFSFSGEEECRVVGLTSSFRGEGKSVTSLNLAYTLAEQKKKVLLIEGDMRLPTLARRLGFSASPGLSNLLVGLNTVTDAIQQFTVPMEDGEQITLDVVVSGDIPPNPSELLGSSRMQSLLKMLRSRYEYVLIDLPPVMAVTDATVTSKIVDGMIIIVRNNHAVRDALAETIRQLKLVNCNILGFVFNSAGDPSSGYYSGRYYRKRGYYGKNYYKNGYYLNSYYADNSGRKKK